jgi:N-acetylglutamate synthase-like GNAT family acetyltransferase
MLQMIRRLQQSDFPEVVEMVANVWGGADHLPALLPKWLEDADSHPLVIVLNGRICGVGNLHVIDGGRTGWMEGLRVGESMRMQGLGRQITQKMVEIASDEGVRRLRLVTAAQSEAPKKLAREAGLAPIHVMKAFWRSLGRSRWRHDTSSIVEVGSDAFLELVRNSTSLVPQGIIYRHYDVFDAEYTSSDVLGDVVCHKGSRSAIVVSLSLGFQRQTKWGSQWCTTIYPRDEDALLSELSYQYYYAREKEAQSIFCIHPRRFAESHVKVPWLKRKNHEIDLVLFERDL